MKMIIFLSLFLLVTTDDQTFARELFPPTSSEFKNYVEHLAKIDDFHRKTGNNFTQLVSNFVINETEENKLDKVYFYVTLMNEIFMRSVFYFVKKYLLIYCEIAEELIERRLKSGTFDEDIVNRIKFEKDPDDYCVVSVLYNSNYNIKPMFHIIFYLQTFYNDPKLMESQSTVIDLKKLRSDFNFHYSLKENSIITDTTSDVPVLNLNKSDEELYHGLLAMKEEFKTMAKRFCSLTPSVSFLKRSLMFEERVKNDYKDEYFNFVMSKERCVIEFKQSPNVFNSSKEAIDDDWYCHNIMSNPTYVYDEYLRDLELTDLEKLKYENEGIKDPIKIEKINSINQEIVREENLKPQHSLVSLRERLRHHYYYLDVFLYNEIEANVLMYSAMKEGRKYFKAINNFFQARCKNEIIYVSDDEFLFMKSRVFLFQLYYDKLHNDIIENLHILFNNGPQKIFKNTIKDLLHHLDFPKNLDENERKELIKKTCVSIKNTLGYRSMDDNIGYKLVNLKFVDYNYNDPIFNTYKLINFIEL